MLKKDDKDGIIAYLRSQLERIAKADVPSFMHYDPEQQTVYKEVTCPECDETWEIEIEAPEDTEASNYIHEDAFDEMREIAEKALLETTW